MGGHVSQPSRTKSTADGGRWPSSTARYGVSAMRGWRPTMEDAHLSVPDLNEDFGLFAVFDGHGGSDVAHWVSLNFEFVFRFNMRRLTDFLDTLTSPPRAAQSTFFHPVAPTDLTVLQSVINAESTTAIVNSLQRLDDRSLGWKWAHYKPNQYLGPADLPIEALCVCEALQRTFLDLDCMMSRAPFGDDVFDIHRALKATRQLSKPMDDSVHMSSFTEARLVTASTKTKRRQQKRVEEGENVPLQSNTLIEVENVPLQSNTLVVEVAGGKSGNHQQGQQQGIDVVPLQSVSGLSDRAAVSSDSGESSCGDAHRRNDDSPVAVGPVAVAPVAVAPVAVARAPVAGVTPVVADRSSDTTQHCDADSNDRSNSCRSTNRRTSIDKQFYNSTVPKSRFKNQFRGGRNHYPTVTGRKSCRHLRDFAPRFTTNHDSTSDGNSSSSSDGFSRRLQKISHAAELCGCTAVVALIFRCQSVGGASVPVVCVGSVGDSRAVLCRRGKAVQLSVDHKPESLVEEIRIMTAGGEVSNGRVSMALNLSRSLGDLAYKKNPQISSESQVISAMPDVHLLPLCENDEFLVLACDGIWDCMSNYQVTNFIRSRLVKAKMLEAATRNEETPQRRTLATRGTYGTTGGSISATGGTTGDTNSKRPVKNRASAMSCTDSESESSTAAASSAVDDDSDTQVTASTATAATASTATASTATAATASTATAAAASSSNKSDVVEAVSPISNNIRRMTGSSVPVELRMAVRAVTKRVSHGGALASTVLSKICSELCDVCVSPDPAASRGLGCDNMTVMIVTFNPALLSKENAATKGASHSGTPSQNKLGSCMYGVFRQKSGVDVPLQYRGTLYNRMAYITKDHQLHQQQYY